MTRVWYFMCFVFGSGLVASEVSQQTASAHGNIQQKTQSVAADAPANMVMIRMKRNPARSMTFSGYLPSGGMTFASTDMFSPYGAMRYPSEMSMWPYPAQPEAPSRNLEPPSRSDSYGSSDESSTLSPAPVSENESSWPEKDSPSDGQGMTTWSVPKKNKKKGWYSPKMGPATTQLEDEDEYVYKGDSGAKAQASFNAWFPIMLGMFPYPHGENGAGSAAESPTQKGSYPSSSSSGSQNTPVQSEGSPSQESASPSRGQPFRYYGTTVVANSVNNGRSGIASSTATAYGGEPSQHRS